MNNRLYKVTTSPLQANLSGGIPDCERKGIFFSLADWVADSSGQGTAHAGTFHPPILEYRGFNLERRLVLYSRS